MTKILISISDGLATELTDLSKVQNISKTELVRRAIRAYVRNQRVTRDKTA